MLFLISAIHSLAILATAGHEPTSVEIGFTILYNSDEAVTLISASKYHMVIMCGGEKSVLNSNFMKLEDWVLAE